MPEVVVPDGLAAYLVRFAGEDGAAWAKALPGVAAGVLERWSLTVDGPAAHGMCALVLPVLRADGEPAVLKLQRVDDENVLEGQGLRIWDGQGTVRLLDEDPAVMALLLERLDASRPLSTVADDLAATQVIAELLLGLTAVPAPAGMRRLGDIAQAMLEYVPRALPALPDAEDRRLVQVCADVVREVVAEPGDRLLHWDLHFDNVLAGVRQPWLAIDPKPLAGDPCFELLPALHNRWAEIVATGDAARAVLRRFDLMSEVLGLDRRRATAWTLGRILQNALWDVEDGENRVDPIQAAIFAAFSWRGL
jgi:streptomycin 6-kinase